MNLKQKINDYANRLEKIEISMCVSPHFHLLEADLFALLKVPFRASLIFIIYVDDENSPCKIMACSFNLALKQTRNRKVAQKEPKHIKRNFYTAQKGIGILVNFTIIHFCRDTITCLLKTVSLS
jgi:hypothetical protein